MLGTGKHGIVCNKLKFKSFEEIKNELEHPTDQRIYAIAEAIKQNVSIDEIHKFTKIDRWFLFKIKNIVEVEKQLSKCKKLKQVSKDLLLLAKQYGYSDFQIAKTVLTD